MTVKLKNRPITTVLNFDFVMDKKILDLLDNYFETGKIDYSEATLNELNISEKELKEHVHSMDNFLSAINIVGKQELKKEMEVWQVEMDMADFAGGAAPDSAEIPHATLKQYFAEQPQYASLVASANRNAALVLESPANGFSWDQETIPFILKNTNTQELDFVIENNQNKTILKDKVFIEDNIFDISLDLQKLLPGRYYLKLIKQSQVSLFEFFVRKDLMPD